MVNTTLEKIFEQSLKHRQEHECGAYPYEFADMLSILVNISHSKRILEFGTGLGYTAAFLASKNEDVHIDTIDRDEGHMELARANWQEIGVSDKITAYVDKAEVILPELEVPYDLIFFDGHTPSMKFLIHFERLLKKGGLLVTANMFLRDKTGGKYMRALQRHKKWQVGVYADTAVALKLFDNSTTVTHTE